MSAAVTNPYTVTWGSFVCGGTTEKLITGLHRVSKDHGSFAVTFDVLVRGTSDATFATNCAELESEFAKRRQLILLQVGSSTIQTFNPSDTVNTGLNSYARIEKVGTPGADTDRSRLYTVTLGCELPATDASGRRDINIIVEYDPAKRRTVTFQGVWTAVTTLNATAKYAAEIDAYCTSALAALLPSGTFERIGERTERDDQDKVIRFTRQFREIIVAQPSGSLDNANIVEPTLAFARSIDAPGDSGGGGVKRLETITARFECFLDKTASTDLATLYTGTIRPYILSELASRFSPTQFAAISEQPTYSPYTNVVSVTVVFTCAIDATDVIESTTSRRIVEKGGKVMTGAWVGKLFAKYVDQGHAQRLRLGIRAVRVLGAIHPKERVGAGEGTVFGVGFFDPGSGRTEPGTGVPGGPTGGGLGNPSGNGWHLIDNDSMATTKTIGQPGEDQITVTDLVETTVEEWVEPPEGGGGPDFGVDIGGGGELAPRGGLFVK